MKILGIMTALVFILGSCLPVGDRDPGETVTLSGILHKTQTETIKVGENVARLDEQGNFSLHFNLLKADYFTLDCGEKFPLFITPGDNIVLEADMENFLSSLNFSGQGSAVNNFLKNQTLREEEHSQSIAIQINQIFALNEDKFVAKLDSFNALFLNPLNEFLTAHKYIDKKFSEFEKAKLLYSWAEGRMVYPEIHRRITREHSFLPSDNYYDFLSLLDLNDSDLLKVDEFMSFISTYLDQKKNELNETRPNILAKDNQNTSLQFMVVLETFTNPILINLYLFEAMKNQIENYGILGIEDLMKDFMVNCTDEKYTEEIGQLYDENVALRQEAKTVIYKEVGNIPLEMFLFFPEDRPSQAGKRPAIVFFHGGGWTIGKPEWAFSRCRYFASRGMVAASAQYRLVDRHGVTPIQCIADAKSAVRWLRQNANELSIDPNRIAAGGWSSGAHIAACAGIIEGFEETTEELAISSVPNAMVFWFPAIDLSGDNWFRQILKGRVDIDDVNPSLHIRAGLPPTVIFQGTADTTVPFFRVKQFVDKMLAEHNRCDFHIYEGREHLFHNNPADYQDTMIKADRFLSSLGFLAGHPQIDRLKN